MTVLQPPSPSPTHSVNPDHSAFGTATLYAENRTTDPTYGRRPDWRDRVLFSACGQEIFIGGDPNHVTSAATATREYAAATATTNTPCPTSLCRPTRARSLAVPLHPYTIPAFTAPSTRCAYYHNDSDAPAHTHTASHPAPTRLCLSHNTMVQTGRHPNELRLRFLVRYISMKFRPSPAEFIHATTAFPCPNWPQLHPTKTPTHAPTAQPATSSRLTAAAATSKSPSDAAATASGGATTSFLRLVTQPATSSVFAKLP